MRTRTSSSTPPSSSSIRRASLRSPRPPSRATWRSCRSTRRDGRAGSGACCGFASVSLRSRSSARTGSRRSRSSATSSSPKTSGRVRAVPTEEREVIPCGVVFRSVGYRGVAVPGVPFDEERGDDAQPRAGGCSTRAASRCRASTARAGSSAGRPASSARTRRTRPRRSSCCSRTPPRALCRDARTSRRARVDAALAERGVDVVSYAGWEAIDAIERARGDEQGRPRVKLAGLGRAARLGPNGHGGGVLPCARSAR